MGSADSIEQFYREHASSVYAFLVSLCGDRTWAEDLMQDTFVKATRALGGYRGGNPRAWLFAIARNTFLDDARRSRPEPVHAVEEVAVPAEDIAEQDLIERTLATLPRRQRVALVLSDHAGLGAAEVGDALGISPAAARVLVHRARHAFRAQYQEEDR